LGRRVFLSTRYFWVLGSALRSNISTQGWLLTLSSHIVTMVHKRKKSRAGFRKRAQSAYIKKRANTRSRRNYRRLGRTNLGVRRSMGLSLPARKYLEAQFNPFGSLALGASIPDQSAFPSQKIMLRRRGTFVPSPKSTSLAKGYITLNPYAVTKDGNFAINTSAATATAAASDELIVNDTAGSFAQAYLDTPYTAAQMVTTGANGKTNRIRVVGAGIRVAYAGQWDALQGSVITTATPTGGFYLDTVRNTTIENLLDLDNSAFGALSHNTTYTATFRHSSPTDYGYVSGDVAADGFLAVVIDNCNTSAVFAYDVIVHLEMVGEDANGESPSPSDPNGLGCVTSLPRTQYLNTPASSVSTAMAKMAARKRKR